MVKKVIYAARTAASGYEYWITDGTPGGTVMITELNPGTPSGAGYALGQIGNDVIVVSANSGTNFEVWATDGTAGGTRLVGDINGGPTTSNPYAIGQIGNVIVLAATGPNGTELYRTDGNTVTPIQDIRPGTSSSSPIGLGTIGTKIFFSADDGTNGRELWVMDGTSGGATLIKDINPLGNGIATTGTGFVFGGRLFFRTNLDGVWTSDGTSSGTAKFGSLALINDAVVYNNKLIFAGASTLDGGVEQELWISDGTVGGTSKLKDIYPGTSGSSPFGLTVFNGFVYFAAANSTNGRELWRTDGTTAGTVMVADLRAGAEGSNPSNFVVFEDKLLFTTQSVSGNSILWVSDGTAAGTQSIATFSFVEQPVNIGNKVVFSGNDELWETDGTIAGTKLLKDINPGGTSAPVVVWVLDTNGPINGTPGPDNLQGTTGDDTINGFAGNDILNGRLGADTMNGGDGNDTYYVDNAGDQTNETNANPLTGGIDLVNSFINWTLGQHIERLTLLGNAQLANGNTLANFLTGNGANNTIMGFAGHDTLVGGIGADTMHGGEGNDTYHVDNAGDRVVETLAGITGGIDHVFASVTFALGINQEKLTLTGAIARNGTGNNLDNTIVGNNLDNALYGLGGNDTLDGAGGNDIMNGGFGNDIYYVRQAGDIVVEADASLEFGGRDAVISTINYVLARNVENLILTASAISGTGNALNNQITGNALANVLVGQDGNDFLDGRAGADSMVGGRGNDTYVVDNAGDRIVGEGATESVDGTDTVLSYVSYVLSNSNVENLTLFGSAISGRGNGLANVLKGNANNNVLLGLAGNDRLDGGAGNDNLQGGLGRDTYVVDSLGDVTLETAPNTGADLNDTVQASVSNWVLGANIENLVLIGGATRGSGNALNNKIYGNALANTLSGFAGDDAFYANNGNDTMIGGDGDDTYYISGIGDDIIEQGTSASGYDVVYSGASYVLSANLEELRLTGSAVSGAGNTQNNFIYGTAGANILLGGGGDDFLAGLAGADRMEGGFGNDTYSVDNAGDTTIDSGSLAGGTDWVYSTVDWTLSANIEHLQLFGADAIDATGNTLANVLFGNGAANRLDGKEGNDRLFGGGGADFFTFTMALGLFGNTDTIIDFNPLQDSIWIDDAIIGGNVITAQTFKNLATGALDASDRIYYDPSNGGLYYDQDGNGVSIALKIATLENRVANVNFDGFVVF